MAIGAHSNPSYKVKGLKVEQIGSRVIRIKEKEKEREAQSQGPVSYLT